MIVVIKEEKCKGECGVLSLFEGPNKRISLVLVNYLLIVLPA